MNITVTFIYNMQYIFRLSCSNQQCSGDRITVSCWGGGEETS